METSQSGESTIFMCKVCNLFSPSRTQLVTHVTETHTSDGHTPETVIVPLKPLSQDVTCGKNGVLTVKRKRGRPKGSTKKACTVTEPALEDSPSHTHTQDPEAPLVTAGQEQESKDNGDSLECKKCSRTFSNRRQITKHICIIGLKEEGEEEHPSGNDPEVRLPTPKRARGVGVCPERVVGERDTEQAGVSKQPIISVVLAAHEAIPGATKIIPIEASPAETLSSADQDCGSQTAEVKRGYQEYAIQQVSYDAGLKSNRPCQVLLKIFTCEYCNKVFKFKHSLQSHLRIHTNEKPFKCPHCDYASAIKANLSVHIRKHTGEKFSCELCSFSSRSRGHLRVHVERVHQRVKHKCAFCHKKYGDLKNLLKHMREGHSLDEREVRESYEELTLQTREGKRQLLYDCHVCERKYKNEQERDRHMVVHGNARPFGCELCDHTSTKHKALQVHVSKHPFVYACALCEQKFVSSVRLRGHLQDVHAEADQLAVFAESISCSFCLLEPGSDVQRDSLKQEELRMTEELSLLNGNAADAAVEMSSETLQEECGISADKEAAASERLTADQQANRESSVESHTSPNSPEPEEPGAEKVDLPLSGQDAVQPEDAASTTQAPTGGATVERTAFMQIIDGMQKRELSVEMFERIRKVYGELECEYCGKLFWYQVHYNLHMRTHTREHLHYCSQCSYSSVTKSCLQRHIIHKHSDTMFCCPTEGCQYGTPDPYKLQVHLKVHSDTDKKDYICPACEQTFSDDKLFTTHIKTLHPEVSGKTISEVLGRRVQMRSQIGKRGSKCPYCDCYFMKDGVDLQQHIWAHEGVKPLKCSLCAFTTRNKNSLRVHVSRHSQESSHLCDTCGKKFKSKFTLKTHKLVHMVDSKPHKCTKCDYSASRRPQLHRHMEQHTSIKPFRCAHCQYSCNILGSLKRHYNKKHPKEPFSNGEEGASAEDSAPQQGGLKCPACNFVYGTKWEMKKHLKNKHGLKLVQNDVEGVNQWEVVESSKAPAAQYLHITESEDMQGTEAAVSALQDLRYTTKNGAISVERLDPTAVNILQQIIDLGSDNHDAAVASVVAMGPGTVTVVEQVAEEEQQRNHTVMIQDALQQAVAMGDQQQHLVVSSNDMEGIETVTVYTQGEDASQYIVYVQEAVQTEEVTELTQ